MPPIQVFEHESIYTFPDKSGRLVTKEQLDKLYRFNDENGNKYFTGIRNGIRFNSYVGVIQVGNLIIEILPKIDKVKPDDDSSKKQWHNALLQMLATCKKIKIDSIFEAQLAFRNQSLLEIYFKQYLDEIEGLIRMGLIKKYHLKSGNLFAWKGRMDFGKNIQQNLVHQERFYTHHQTYDHEHLINQILLYALNILKNLVNNSSLKDKAVRLLMSFPEIKSIPIQEFHFNQLQPSRKTVPFNQALVLAKMIILNYSPDISAGNDNMLALLFDMNKLWEEYIYRMLIKDIPVGYEIIYQDGQEFWENRTIRPDLVIHRSFADGKKETYLIDTKWRIPENNQPSDDELKQLYAYNMYWEASRSMLLYPEISPQIEEFGKFHKGRLSNNHCKVGYISIFDKDGNLDRNIGSEILKKL
jgi:5-methylcytosine-specific restriction enzyme subunit McrC